MRCSNCYKLKRSASSGLFLEHPTYLFWSIKFDMRFSLLQIGAALGLAASVGASSSPGRNVFERAEKLTAKSPIIEKREIGKPFEHPGLQKRASPYLNNATESMSLSSRRICRTHTDHSHRVLGQRISYSRCQVRCRRVVRWSPAHQWCCQRDPRAFLLVLPFDQPQRYRRNRHLVQRWSRMQFPQWSVDGERPLHLGGW